jgi:hypothetical protein
LWRLPIGGQLTLSRDGRRLLVASNSDTCFYVVDVEAGAVRRKLTPKNYYKPSGLSTVYMVDEDLKWMTLEWTDMRGLWDIEADTLLTAFGENGIFYISSRLNRMYGAHKDALALLNARTLEVIHSYPVRYGTRAWFDDDRGVFYLTVDHGIEEYDAETGIRIRGTYVDAVEGVVRRPKDSQWLYYFTTGLSQGYHDFVEAVHLETGERVRFFGPSNPRLGMHLGTAGESFIVPRGGDVVAGFDSGLQSPVFAFDAQGRVSRVIVDPPPFRDPWDSTRISARECAITPDLTRYLHTLDADEANTALVCQALIPNTTSAASEPPQPRPGPAPWARVADGELVLTPPGTGPIHAIDITATDGRIARSAAGPFDQRPVRIGLAGLPAGLYFCTIRRQGGALSASFTISR